MRPDDESISTGGVLARYGEEGLRTVLVTCSGGEVGEIADPGLATPRRWSKFGGESYGRPARSCASVGSNCWAIAIQG
jgi:N-acetyl-1-D-myo-inositol-2-amino-2-deoxy-alpha-D-glucopyranoside deacetylase